MRFDSITVLVNGVAFPSDRSAVDLGIAHVAHDITVKWSRANSLSSPDAQELALTIRRRRDHVGQRTDPIYTMDSRVIVRVVLAGISVDVFDGLIDRVRFEPAPIGGWQDVKIGAVCWKARAQRRRVGAPPWPQESMATRYGRLTTILPELLDRPTIASTTTMVAKAMDIDSRDPIEVIDEHFAARQAVSYAASGGVRHLPLGGTGIIELTVRLLQKRTFFTRDFGLQLVTLPARAIRDVGREISFDSLLAAVTFNFTFVSGDGKFSRDSSRTFGNSSRPGSSMSVTTAEAVISSSSPATQEAFDRIQPPYVQGGEWSYATQDSEPTYRLDPLTLYFEDIPADAEAPLKAADIVELIGLDTRWSTILTIEGAPADVPFFHRFIGGTLTLSGDPSRCALTLETEPGQYRRTWPAITWATWSTATWGGYEAAWDTTRPYDGGVAVTWRDMQIVQRINPRD